MPRAASPIIVLRHEGFIAVALSQPFTGAMVHSGFEADQGFYPVGLQDWPGAFA